MINMANKHRTMRGEPIDMAALVAQNGTAPAVGNARLNARGDVLAQNGSVLRTQEQVEAEWRRQKEAQMAQNVPPMNLKAPIEQQLPSTTIVEQDEFEPPKVDTITEDIPTPAAPAPTRRRKIIEE
jgi:hypothetical protein